MLTLEETIQLILKNTKHDRKYILQLIEEKRQELGPEVVNDESAAMIVARELGVDLHQLSPRARTRIADITEATRNVVLTAKVKRVDPARTFAKPGGGEGKVASILVADESGQIRVALWDEMTKAVEEDGVSVGDVIQIRGAYVKKGLKDTPELNLGRLGGISKLEDEEIEDLKVTLPPTGGSKIGGLQVPSLDLTLTFKVQRVFNLTTFKRSKDGSEGKVMSVIGADETGSARVVFWDSLAQQMADAKEGEVVRLTGAYTKKGRNDDLEIHAGRSSEIQRGLKEKIDAVESKGPQPFGKVAIGELSVSMKDVDVEGKVASKADIREFDKGETRGRVRSIVVGDESGSTRVTFWNDDVDRVEDMREGDTIRIRHGYVKEGFRGGVELHIGKRAEIQTNPPDLNLDRLDISQIQTAPTFRPVRLRIADIGDNMVNQSVEILGMIVDVPDASPFYLACDKPDCKKKVEENEGVFTCSIHKTVEKPIPLLLFKLTLDDGSGSTTRVTVFDSLGEKLLNMSADDVQRALKKSENPLDKMKGDYLVVRGTVKKFRDSIEIAAREASKSNMIDEIKRAKEDVRGLLG